MKNVYVETYGCSANLNNSEIMKGILIQSNYNVINNPNIAEIIILNTCIVKGKTENKIKRRIQDLTSEKKLIIVTGCMPETDAKQIKKLNPNILLLGTHHFKQIVQLIKDYSENNLTKSKQETYLSKFNEEKVLLPKHPENSLISITQISEGCQGKCTFCKTRLAKGNLYSYPMDKIIKSVESDLRNGAKEVWITSQDNASYGLDKKFFLLPELLNKILSLKHRFKLRIGMMNPNNLYPILDQMIEVYKNPKVYKFLHLPVQSGSNKLLKAMNRLYTIQKAEEIIKRFKDIFPEMVFSTDIIVGYPTETNDDFRQSLNFIKTFQPSVFNLSKFSKHKKTPAEKLKELPISIINKRTTEIMELHRYFAKQNKEKYQNKVIKVFINKKIQPFLYESRDENYNIVLINSMDKTILGKNKNVKIKTIGVHHMIGELI